MKLTHLQDRSAVVWVKWPDYRTSTIHSIGYLPDGRVAFDQFVREAMDMLKRRHRTEADAGAPAVTEQCKLGTQYANLLAFLIDTKYEDGSVRTPGSITIFAATEGGLKACLNDKEAEEVAFVSGNTLTALLKRIHDGIAAGGLDWRSQRKPTKRK